MVESGSLHLAPGSRTPGLKGPRSNMSTCKLLLWPISPKVKENHFKIIHKIYQVAEFLRRRFRFVVDPVFFMLCVHPLKFLIYMYIFIWTILIYLSLISFK